jgi:hypothetical protein
MNRWIYLTHRLAEDPPIAAGIIQQVEFEEHL